MAKKINFGSKPVLPLVQEAATIVEELIGNNTFFLHTFGSVLRQIAGDSPIVKSNLTEGDILQIRSNLAFNVSYCMAQPQTSYMDVDPGMPGTPSVIIMNPSVRSPGNC